MIFLFALAFVLAVGFVVMLAIGVLVGLAALVRHAAPPRPQPGVLSGDARRIVLAGTANGHRNGHA